MSFCRSCDAPIEWVTLKSGKNHPVDPDYINWMEAKEGDKLVTDSGDILTVNNLQNLPNVKGRISHFATCPQANEWRKK